MGIGNTKVGGERIGAKSAVGWIWISRPSVPTQQVNAVFSMEKGGYIFVCSPPR